MERLTKRNGDNVAYWNGANGKSFSDNQGNIYGEAITKLAEYEDAEEQGLLIKRNKADEVYLRMIACEVMEHQKNYSEDVYHMFSKGVQAFFVAIEKALEEMR